MVGKGGDADRADAGGLLCTIGSGDGLLVQQFAHRSRQVAGGSLHRNRIHAQAAFDFFQIHALFF